MGPSSAVSKDAGGGAEDHQQRLRALAARTVTDSLRAAVSRSGAAEKAARLEECARSLEAEKAKMEVFRRELPISVHLITDVIEWLRDEVAQQRRPAPDQPLAQSPSPAPPAKRKTEGFKAEADASDKRSWMSSAQLWTCGSTGTSNGGSDRRQAQKVSNAFMPLNGLPTSAKSSDIPEAAAMAVPDLSLSSPAINASCPAAPSTNSSAVTDAGEQQSAQRKARRCWSPELHRRFVAALQRLGGPHAATPKQIRDMMKVDGLTNDEVKSHLQKYRLHTRRASNSDHQRSPGVWPPPEHYTTSQHSTSQQSSGSPQGPLQLATGSSRAVSVTAGDSSVARIKLRPRPSSNHGDKQCRKDATVGRINKEISCHAPGQGQGSLGPGYAPGRRQLRGWRGGGGRQVGELRLGDATAEGVVVILNVESLHNNTLLRRIQD